MLTYDEKGIVDIDIIDGEPRYVVDEQNTQDQRAALAAYVTKGTVPGMLDTGVDWSMLETRDKTLIDIDNQVKQQLTNFAVASDASAGQGYAPMYTKEKGHLAIAIVRTGA